MEVTDEEDGGDVEELNESSESGEDKRGVALTVFESDPVVSAEGRICWSLGDELQESCSKSQGWRIASRAVGRVVGSKDSKVHIKSMTSSEQRRRRRGAIGSFRA